MTDNRRKFLIKTLGCKVNQYESQAIRESMVRSGFNESGPEESADICIINTCTVTRKADTESRYWAGVFHKMNPGARIVITGCCAEEDAGLFLSMPGVTDIVKNADKGRIAGILGGKHDTQYAAFSAITDFKNHTKAFVKIQDGCNNFCAYCKVPLVRGEPRSKPLDVITKEVRALVSKGFKEIVLTGICLGAWGSESGGRCGMTGVLKAVCGIDGDFRIRLSSIEPKHITDELTGYINENKKVCRHLHIPVQSGDDTILASMNRPYTGRQLIDVIDGAKKAVDGMGITTDIMVGFPGETDRQFLSTVELIKHILPVRTHIFPFSKRDGTAACSMTNEVPSGAVRNRLNMMRTAAIEASYLYRGLWKARDVDVLVESKRERYSGRLTGYSGNYIKVSFDGPDSLMKKIVPVKIEELNLTCTLGSAAQEKP